MAMMPRLTLSLALLLVLPGCAPKAPPADAATPAPLLNERALAGCAYEPIATVEEQRTTPVINAHREMERALGLKARWINADAIIQMKVAEIIPVMGGGPVASNPNGRRASGVRASALAIRITAPCPAKKTA